MISSDNIGGKLDKTLAPSGDSFRTKLDERNKQAQPGDSFRTKPSTIWTRDLWLAVAQLRQAYAQLAAGEVTNQKEFADRLISPQIERIENMLRRLA